MTDIYLVTLIAAPSLEENLVDWLLSHESRREAESLRLNESRREAESLRLNESRREAESLRLNESRREAESLRLNKSRREADCDSCAAKPASSDKCCHGFTSFAVSGHSSRHQGLSLEEQVAGRKKQVGFEMHIRGPDLAALLAGLKQDFAGTGLHYWVTPVLDSGTL
ncbi:MAG: DUF3240 domain-containing protein [Methylococcaceae bacterium]|nr:MAG: DUF3240 domain-containing protein [Methylococcaceae bacterium]